MKDIILTTIIFITLITTLSRFAWFGFLLAFIYGIVIVALMYSKKIVTKKSVYLLIGSGVVVAIILTTGIYDIIIKRMMDVQATVLDTTREEGMVSNTLDTRALIWITALNTFLHNKFTGVGYFMFYKVSENYNILPHDIYDEFIWGLDAHSTFLNFLAETGILGFTMFVVYLCSSFYYSFKSIKLSLTNEQKQISIILNVLLFFIITTSIYSGAFTFGYNGFVLHIFIGLVIANYVVIKINSQREIEKTYQ
jgi:O-antigen ligase